MREGARTTQASSALGAVRARHDDLQQVEQAIADLTGLFQSLEILIVCDEAKIVHIDQHAADGIQDLEKANEEIRATTKTALHRRKMKRLLLVVVVLIVLLLAGLGVGLYYVLRDRF